MSKIILGMDISSTTSGWCILRVNEDIIEYIDSGYFKPLKEGTIFERLNHSRIKIREILNAYKPDEISVENVIEFLAGKSSSKTIITLAVFNRNAGMTAYDYLGRSPELFSVMQIRHGLKLNKIFPKKEDMPALVSKHLGIKFPYEYNKKNNLKVENYDRADAIAVALYHAFVITNKIKNKVKKKK